MISDAKGADHVKREPSELEHRIKNAKTDQDRERAERDLAKFEADTSAE